MAAPLALAVGCLVGFPALAKGPPRRPAAALRPGQLFLSPGSGALGDGISQISVEGMSSMIPNPLGENFTNPIAGMIPNPLDGNFTHSITGPLGTLNIGDPSAFADNFSIGANLPYPTGGNFTFGADATQMSQGIALGSQAFAPLGNISSGIDMPDMFQGNPLGVAFADPGQAFGNAVAGANAMNPFNRNVSAENSSLLGPLTGISGMGIPFAGNQTVGGTFGQAQGAVEQAGEAVMDRSKDYWPTYVDADNEYYDNDTVIAGSWHWATCGHEHMYKCHSHLAGFVNACCCEAGFAFVAGNAGAPLVHDTTVGAATGAAHGAIVTGAMLGSDMGASTATGAATGAVSGAITGTVMYLFEGGECQAKGDLSEAVREHLS